MNRRISLLSFFSWRRLICRPDTSGLLQWHDWLYFRPRRIRSDTEAAVKLELQFRSKLLAPAYCMLHNSSVMGNCHNWGLRIEVWCPKSTVQTNIIYLTYSLISRLKHSLLWPYDQLLTSQWRQNDRTLYIEDCNGQECSK